MPITRTFATVILLLSSLIFVFPLNALHFSAPLQLTTPSTTPIPTITPTLSPTASLSEEMDVIETRVAMIEQVLEKPSKDIWDKANAISGILSGVIVALVGLLATYTYNQRQLANEQAQKDREIIVSQVQTAQTFMPQLQSGIEREVEAALLAIAALGNTKLATDLASLYRTNGSVSALYKMSLSSNAEISQQAKLSLDNVLGLLNVKNALVEIEVVNKDGSGGMASGFIVDKRGYIATVSYAVQSREQIIVRVSDKEYKAKVITLDPEQMLAILKIDDLRDEETNFQFLTFASSDDVKISDQVFLFGPKFLTGEQTLSIGQVTGLNLTRKEALIKFISLQVETAPGFGGTPVLNQFGQVIGMHTFYDREIGQRFMIPSSYIINLVDAIPT